MILRARRSGYQAKNLAPLLEKHHSLFEHWTHDASILPARLHGVWQHRFARDRERLKSRWTEWHEPDFLTQLDTVRERITLDGACRSGDLAGDAPRASGGWWDWHPSKTALEYLWRSGQLSVVRRDNFRKVYDLTERVIPAERLNARMDEADTVEWACGRVGRHSTSLGLPPAPRFPRFGI